MKYFKDEEMFVITRDWNKINYNNLIENIMNSEKYSLMLTDNDPERITINLIN